MWLSHDTADEQSRAPEYASRAVLKLRIFRAYPVTRDVELNRFARCESLLEAVAA
jgi:hypothetical protein